MASGSVTLTYDAPAAIPPSDIAWIGLHRELGDLHGHTALQWFRWDVDPGDPTKFDYRIKAVDGRLFTQDYIYDGSPEQPTIKTGGDHWSLVEINLHRDVRAYVLALVAAHGATKIHATF